MSRWITITVDHLKAEGHGALMDRARTVAVGGIDPVTQAITGATARVRRAVSPGNILDADDTKVPASLQDVTIRAAIYSLMRRIHLPLSKDDSDQKRTDDEELISISKNKTKVELPDDPAASAEMQESGGNIEARGVPRRQTGRDRTSGL